MMDSLKYKLQVRVGWVGKGVGEEGGELVEGKNVDK